MISVPGTRRQFMETEKRSDSVSCRILGMYWKAYCVFPKCSMTNLCPGMVVLLLLRSSHDVCSAALSLCSLIHIAEISRG
jgi:hypothetical protein